MEIKETKISFEPKVSFETFMVIFIIILATIFLLDAGNSTSTIINPIPSSAVTITTPTNNSKVILEEVNRLHNSEYHIGYYNQGSQIYSYFTDMNDNVIEFAEYNLNARKIETFSGLTFVEFINIINEIDNHIKMNYADNSKDYTSIYNKGFVEINNSNFFIIPIESDYLKNDYQDEYFMQVIMHNDLYFITYYNYELEIPILTTFKQDNAKYTLKNEAWTDYDYINIHSNNDTLTPTTYFDYNFLNPEQTVEIEEDFTPNNGYESDSFTIEFEPTELLLYIENDVNIVTKPHIKDSLIAYYQGDNNYPEEDKILIETITNIIGNSIEINPNLSADEVKISIDEFVTFGNINNFSYGANTFILNTISVVDLQADLTQYFSIFLVPYTTDDRFFKVVFMGNSTQNVDNNLNNEYYDKQINTIMSMLDTFELN